MRNMTPRPAVADIAYGGLRYSVFTGDGGESLALRNCGPDLRDVGIPQLLGDDVSASLPVLGNGIRLVDGGVPGEQVSGLDAWRVVAAMADHGRERFPENDTPRGPVSKQFDALMNDHAVAVSVATPLPNQTSVYLGALPVQSLNEMPLHVSAAALSAHLLDVTFDLGCRHTKGVL